MKNHKTFIDVQRVVDERRPAKAVDHFIADYLRGVALVPTYAAEEEYAGLLLEDPEQPITEAVVDDEGNELSPAIDHAAIRAERLLAIAAEYPHIPEPLPEFVTVDIGHDENGEVIMEEREIAPPNIDQRRPSPAIDVTAFKETAIVSALRKAEYPDVGDQLDAIWKQLNQDRLGGKGLIQECDDVLGLILAIKAKHSKRE